MKKILLILILWCGYAQAQTPPGYTLINQRYEWLAGIFKGLGLPSGASPAFSAGQAVRDGAVFFDTVQSAGSQRGLYIYTDGVWELQGTPSGANLPDELLCNCGRVTYSGTGLLFSVSAAVYRIDNVIYASDSGSFTLPASDPDFDRFSRVYLGTDNAFHVLNGTPAIPAIVPQVQGDQLPLTEIMVRAAATGPDITQTIIYDENTESIVSNSGTTTDPNNATNTFQGVKSLNVTNINNGDFVFFDTDGTPPTWSLTNVDALSLHIKLKAVMPTPGRIWAQFFNGLTAASTEVSMAFNHFNITTYQAISVPMSSFGTITNYNITRVRLRYSSSDAVNYTGFYVDYMFLVDGIVQGGNGAVNQVSLVMPSAFTVTGSPGTGNVFLSVAGSGNSTQFIDGTGALTAFPNLVDTVSTLDGRAKNADGGTIDGRELFLQTVDISGNPGLATSAMKMKWDSTYWDTNLGHGDTILRAVNDSTNGFKSFIPGSGITITPTDTTLVFSASAAASRFGVTGEDVTATQNRAFETTDAFQFRIRHTGATTTQSLDFYDDQNVKLTSDGAEINVGGGVGVSFTGPIFTVNGLVEPPGTTNKMMVWDSTDARWYATAIPSGGGGVTNVATGLGLSGGPITTTGTILVDTANASILSRQRAAATYVPIVTTDPVHSGTNASGAGMIPTEYDVFVRSDETLANSSADQDLFGNAAHNTIAVLANTTYEFSTLFDLAHNATSHSLSFGMLPTTAVITNIAYNAYVWTSAIGSTTVTNHSTRVKVTSTVAISTAGAFAVEAVEIRGWFTVGATGGTISPTIKFSADPTGTILLKAGSEFHIKAKGNDTFTERGPFQ